MKAQLFINTPAKSQIRYLSPWKGSIMHSLFKTKRTPSKVPHFFSWCTGYHFFSSPSEGQVNSYNFLTNFKIRFIAGIGYITNDSHMIFEICRHTRITANNTTKICKPESKLETCGVHHEVWVSQFSTRSRGLFRLLQQDSSGPNLFHAYPPCSHPSRAVDPSIAVWPVHTYVIQRKCPLWPLK